MNKPNVSVVLGSYNRLHFLKLTIDSIRQELTHFPHEIIVIDGGSDDGSMEWLNKQKDIITIIQHNRGTWQGKAIKRKPWGYFMNLGFKVAQSKYVCMLSDDCLIVPGAIENGYNLFEKNLKEGKNIGAMAFYFRSWPQEEAYHVGTPIGHKMYVNHGLYLKKALEKINYIDEERYSFYFGDIDLCFRLWQAGYQCIESPDSYIEHYPHANLPIRQSNNKMHDQDFKTFLDTWQPVYTDLTNHNISMTRKKNFNDSFNTKEKFSKLHENVLQEHEKFFREPSFGQRVYSTLKWKLKMLKRKLKR